MSQAERRDRDSIDEVLGKAHEQMGALLSRLGGSIGAAAADAPGALQAFTRELTNHMMWEEEILFPAVKQRATAAQKRSIESLEIDHERLRDTLKTLDSTLSAGDYSTAGLLVDWLETLLKGHNYDEEHGVYVEADRLLDPAQKRLLLETFRRRSPEGAS